MTTIAHTFPTQAFELGHYEALPRQVIETLKAKGIPVTGDWMLRGVEYGALTVTFYKPDGVTFTWDSLGEEPPDIDDPMDLI